MFFKNTQRNKAVFLDRDGVLIEDTGYPHLPEHLKLKRDILPFLRLLKKKGYLLIIVTNQSGIARGLFSLEQYQLFQAIVEQALLSENVVIDKTYYCPFHKDGSVPEFSRDHEDRKPNPGMILKALEDFDIDIRQSIMIGDRESDIIDYPGLKTYLIQSDYPVGNGIPVYRSYKELFKDAGIL